MTTIKRLITLNSVLCWWVDALNTGSFRTSGGKETTLRNTLLAVLLAIAMSAVAPADVINTDINTQSGRLSAAGTYTQNSGYRYINVSDADGEVAIVTFALPTLTGGTTISDANFYDYCGRSFSATSTDGSDIDLYALRIADSVNITSADFYIGTDDTGATKIQTDLFTRTSVGGSGQPPTNPNVNTDATGDSNLATWLSAQYTGDTPNATYAIFRLNSQGAPGGSYFGYTMANGSTRAVLTITTIPEPATLALLATGGLCLLRRKRR